VYGSGTAEHVTVGAVAWVDIDARVKLAREALRELLFAPSAIVHTGRGVHAYWLLSEPHEATTCARLSGQLAELVDGDRTSDPARLLRLPGSRNTKHDGSPLARLKLLDLGRRYHVEDLRDWLDEMAPPKRPTARTKPVVSPGQLGLMLARRRRIAPSIAKRAIERVRLSNVGERNTAVYVSARDLGQLSAEGFPIDAAVEALLTAAVTVGLSKAEAQAATENGLRKGTSEGWRFDASRLSRAGTPQVVTGKHR